MSLLSIEWLSMTRPSNGSVYATRDILLNSEGNVCLINNFKKNCCVHSVFLMFYEPNHVQPLNSHTVLLYNFERAFMVNFDNNAYLGIFRPKSFAS